MPPGVVDVGMAVRAIVVGASAAQAVTRLKASIDPRPEAQSYPVAAA